MKFCTLLAAAWASSAIGQEITSLPGVKGASVESCDRRHAHPFPEGKSGERSVLAFDVTTRPPHSDASFQAVRRLRQLCVSSPEVSALDVSFDRRIGKRPSHGPDRVLDEWHVDKEGSNGEWQAWRFSALTQNRERARTPRSNLQVARDARGSSAQASSTAPLSRRRMALSRATR